jgi:hypothetical protein
LLHPFSSSSLPYLTTVSNGTKKWITPYMKMDFADIKISQMSTFAVGSMLPLKPRAHTNRKSKGMELDWRISSGFRLGCQNRPRLPGGGGRVARSLAPPAKDRIGVQQWRNMGKFYFLPIFTLTLYIALI